MSEVKSATLDLTILKGYASKSSSKDNAWKEELEKQIYQKNNMQHINHGSTKNNAEFIGQSDMSNNKKAVYLSKGNEKQALKKEETSSPINTISNKKIDGLKSPIEYQTNNSNKDAFFSSSQNEINQRKNIEKSAPNHLSSLGWNTVKTEKKEILLKNLPDGEILVRNYLEGKSTIKDIPAFIKSVKHMFGSNVEKVKINGTVIWQNTTSNSQKQNTNHSINLIY